MLFCGIDISTSSIKVIIIDQGGKIVSSESQMLPKSNFFYNDKCLQCHEQNPEDWWTTLILVLKNSVIDLKKLNIEPKELAGITIVGTSGTIIAINQDNQLLTNALMYNDTRAVKEAHEINQCAEEHCEKLGYKFSPPFALSKILWLLRNQPEIINKAKFIHCTDYIVGKLTNDYSKSDFSNSLKTGFDLINLRWPEFIEEELKIPLNKLPTILSPGDLIGSTTEDIEKLTGLPKNTPVFAGITDSTAGLISSGAINIGDLFSVLGSTIVTKVITKNLLKDEKGRIYSHRFPTGTWLLGGAGNCGTLALNEKFGREKLTELDKYILDYTPTKKYIYPLTHQGERFPFNNPYAEGFEIGSFENEYQKYTAYIEGLCYVEKMMFNILRELGAKFNEMVFTVGGATNSSTWMTLRASILNKTILIPEIPEAAFGGAILVASVTYFNGDLNKACQKLVKIKNQHEPDESKLDIYEKEYNNFYEIIQKKLKSEWIES